MSRTWPWLAALLSGVLLTLCLPPWDQGWLCWIALTPLIAAIWFGKPADTEAIRATPRWRRFLRRPTGRAALLGYVTGLVFFWWAFFWLTTVTGIGWFILAFYLALYPAVWAAFLAAASESAEDFTRSGLNLRLAASGAAAWTALEWVRGWLFSGFGWNNLGTALHENLAFIQIVEFTGVGGLSFLVAFTNLIAVITVKRFLAEIHHRKIRPHWDFSLNMALIVGVFLFGVRTLFQPPIEGTTPLRVAAVQPNIPQNEKADLAFEKSVFERLTFLTESALAWNPELLVWPEAATVRGMFVDETNYAFVHQFAARGEVNFLFGTVDFDAEQRDYNVAALLTQQGKLLQIYRKMHLVPFGEYIPFRHSFPLFAWIVGDLVPADYSPGRHYSILRLSKPDLKAAALVCFEDTLGELTRRFVLGGAQLLVNVTNDGWFLKSPASRQHLANAVFRAVENRRPLVRAANTGVTAFINPTGRITSRFDDVFAEGVLTEEIQIPPESARVTFYTRRGEIFSHVCTAFSLFAVALMTLQARRRPTPQ